MVVQFKIGFRDKGVRQFLKTAHSGAEKAALAGVREAASDVAKQAKQNLIDAKYSPFPIQTFGVLGASIRIERVPHLIAFNVVATAAYAKYVHGGRRAGTRPPLSAIEPWVQKKLGITGKRNIKRVAWAVAKKQQTHPLPPKPFLDDAVAAKRGNVAARVRRHVAAWVARVAG